MLTVDESALFVPRTTVASYYLHIPFIIIFLFSLSSPSSSLFINNQKQFGLTATNGKLLRVVPLFETLTDLNNAADVCEILFSLPGYMAAIKGKQEIMVSVLYCSTVQHSTAQHITVLQSTQHSTVLN